MIRFSSRVFSTKVSPFKKTPLAPPDAILGITEAFKKDDNPHKMNLGVGAYRSNEGAPFVLPVVREAERLLLEQQLDMEYAPIDGLASFTRSSSVLALGAPLSDETSPRTASLQTLSGTGALRLAGEYLSHFSDADVLLPTPTWGNHKSIFSHAGVRTKQYRYYDSSSVSLDIDGMCADIAAATPGSVILLHACAHNPTGIDPTPEQWTRISEVVAANGHLPLFDMAYQGFATGDPERDAFAVRYFLQEGGHRHLILCQSFAKNFGLYGHRTGALHFVTESEEEASRVRSQAKKLARAAYSNPPLHGARIVAQVLGDEGMTNAWRGEVRSMADRILLRTGIESHGATRPWDHITNQIGMFTYTGLTPEQVARLTAEHSVYLTQDGRISMAGVTTDNVDRLAAAIADVTK
eukprot:CAMPEP_0170753572 /NCGR_PEP_ID=MMETSP0437-20130122/12562_1 /TAXON_ID=0 /ORGANISM="Sexangularia sp." /LENGTH=408 /DNA_ID=CAMNT_0011092695 /DNA_START=46 /DNA_END=1272 /DNA_ORIENTATION=-